MRTPELVLLGGPNSGKTHYAGQLYGRLRRRPGALSLRRDQGTPPDLSALDEVLQCLEAGRAAEHTPAQIWSEVTLPLVDVHDRAIDLRWPDYGGEQLRAVFTHRAVPDAWRTRLTSAGGWVLLIRLTAETKYPDALEELPQRSGSRDINIERVERWDANAQWVELLQILLHVAGLSTVTRLRRPRLSVMLSCYDELQLAERSPREGLAEALPLLSSFIENNWAADAVSVWGLSALGCPLDRNSINDAFVDDGPEVQGWVVPPDGGPRDPDLSRPLAWLLEPL